MSVFLLYRYYCMHRVCLVYTSEMPFCSAVFVQLCQMQSGLTPPRTHRSVPLMLFLQEEEKGLWTSASAVPSCLKSISEPRSGCEL